MNNIRNEVLETQLKLNHFALHKNSPLTLQVWKKTSGLALGERFSAIVKARLESVEFLHTPAEPIIGRVKPWPTDSEAEKAADAELEKLGKLPSPGQTGHCEPYYDEIFKYGLDHIRECCTPLPAFRLAAEALSEFIERAGRQAKRQDVAAACSHIAHKPPRTFQEAIQLLWLVVLAIQAGDYSALIVPGRIDRRLAPFYEEDIKAGRLTRAEALKMISCLYLAINASCGRGLAYSVMVGGNGIYNELSYLALEALRESRLVYPSVGVCWEPDVTPPELRKLAVELIADGFSNVAVFNDALIRKSLEEYGIPAADAPDYINSTCVEITPCGQSNVYVASPYFPLCIILLEYMEKCNTGDYESFKQGYLELLGSKISEAAAAQNEIRKTRETGTRRPLQSIFTRGCIARQSDIEEGGALCNWVECSFVGLANLVDSLYVIRKEVFENKKFTIPELLEILKKNFADAEPLRQHFLNGFPKYGNADAAVDGEIPAIISFIRRECAKQQIYPGNTHFIPGTFCWEMHQRLGAVCGATPDGRIAGFPFADGAGPAQGREKNGPTAALLSVCSWSHSGLLGGTAFNQRYSATAVSTPEARKKLEILIDIFIRQGGFETQINILDAETLKKAQLCPEEYKDLIVRIGGYTDYFTGLSPEMQSEVIQRTVYKEF